MRVKICGVTRPEDARVAEEAGAAYVGAVLVPRSRRCLSPGQARLLSEAISIPLVVVTADLGAEEAARAADESGARAIQLHGNEPEELLRALRGLGGWELWKAVRVRTPEDITSGLDRFGSCADLILLDGWHSTELGGTGVSFPWGALESVRFLLPQGLRLGIAGGLSPENVADAVTRLGPDLVDVSSGVEVSPGVKDHDRVRSFIRRAVEAGVSGS